MKRGSGAGTIAVLTLCCVFGATMLMSLAAGAMVYRNVAGRTERASGRRVGLTYITAKIRGFDGAGQVRVGDFGGQEAVFLRQELEGKPYETVLYVHDGALKELFFEEGLDMAPGDGQEVSAAQNLEVSKTEDGLIRLRFTAPDGTAETADIYLRSGG